MPRSPYVLVPTLLTLAAACSSGGGPTEPESAGDSFKADVDGLAWNGFIQESSTYYDGLTFSLLGIQNGIEIGLTVNTSHPDAVVPGTVDLTDGFTGAHVNEGDETWFPTGEGGSGTLTITELSTGGAKGTFSFVAGPLGGSATGTRTITNGSFDVSF